jgi:peptidoglycan/LPS O-acetylase OafA/YrhL
MTRRFELGPLLVALGALLLLVALFLSWFGPLTAWDAFEITDLLLAALAAGALALAVGALAPDVLDVDARWLPWLAGAAFVVVAVQLLDPPPVALARERHEGIWLALAGTVLMVLGTVLTLGRVSLAVAVEGRERRRRVAAVDHRPPSTSEHAAVPGTGTGAGARRAPESLLRRRDPDPEPGSEPDA